MVLEKTLGAGMTRQSHETDAGSHSAHECQAGVSATVRVAVVGRLAAMSRPELQKHLQERGFVLVKHPADHPHWIVLGEGDLSETESLLTAIAEDSGGKVPILWESELWQRLGLLPGHSGVKTLFTPAMLADLTNTPVKEIRRWYRLGLLKPAHVVYRLPYFDYQTVIRARQLASLVRARISPQRLAQLIARLASCRPDWQETLDQLSLASNGRSILVRCNGRLVDQTGQLYLDLHVDQSALDATTLPRLLPITEYFSKRVAGLPPKSELLRTAEALEVENRLEEATEVYRVILGMDGPDPELCFHLGELLYQLGDLSGARERYFMALELDHTYLEAQVNLGSVLLELGQKGLARSAFEGALALHPDYPDAHLLLAKLLDELGYAEEAIFHWRRFIELAPDTPWSDHARVRLEIAAANGHPTSVTT